MKTLIKSCLLLVLLVSTTTFAQSLFVGPINTFNVAANSYTASKMVRMEIIKTDRYQVMDEFDMMEMENASDLDSCYSKTCLVDYGQRLGADIAVSGSVDKIGAKIIISLKMIDVNNGEIMKTATEQFDDQELELQRMFMIVVNQMLGIENDPELLKRLSFRNEQITSTNVGRINNSGPRMGIGWTGGTLREFMTRPEDQGGLDIQPVMSNLGYQFEIQYVGTENFSALFEVIPTLNGLEQGQFLPSLSLLNGFRFGKGGYEFAFGPSIGLKRTSFGFFDHHGIYGEHGRYWRQGDLAPAGFDGSPTSIEENGYFVEEHLDARGDWKFSTRWVMAVGRTFKSGALNIPVNLFYSSAGRYGGMLGASIGFNITRSKKSINK